MSPPIRDGSGNSINSIRLGDGSEISEVRTGAGDVLFSAIPDTAVLHWPHDEGSGSTLTETIGTFGNQNGTINGAVWVNNTDWWQGQYLEYDGSTDFTDTGDWGAFWSNNLTGHTIIVEAEVPAGDNGYAVGVQEGDHLYGIGPRGFTGVAQGDWGCVYQDPNLNQVAVGTDTKFDDGTRHFFAIAGDFTNASSIDIYVDTQFVPTSIASSSSPNVLSFNREVYYGANNKSGTATSHANIDMGRVMVLNKVATETELDEIAREHGFPA